MGGRTIQPPCAECGMVGPASDFHPHVYCMLYKAGVTDPESYMHATMPMLAEHFGYEAEACTCEPRSVESCPLHGVGRERDV